MNVRRMGGLAALALLGTAGAAAHADACPPSERYECKTPANDLPGLLVTVNIASDCGPSQAFVNEEDTASIDEPIDVTIENKCRPVAPHHQACFWKVSGKDFRLEAARDPMLPSRTFNAMFTGARGATRVVTCTF